MIDNLLTSSKDDKKKIKEARNIIFSLLSLTEYEENKLERKFTHYRPNIIN